jgi:hypothetical protein
MTRGSGCGWRRGVARLTIGLAATALLITTGTPALVSPAGAVAAKTSAHDRAGVVRRGATLTPKPKKKKKAATHRLGKRDYAEFALLALAPFIVMALFLLASGYRRESRASPGP